MKILVTGVAGFIGYHLTLRLLSEGLKVIGIDNVNDYYSTDLKKLRLKNLKKYSEHRNFSFCEFDISDRDQVRLQFKKSKPEIVINLAAQAGVRYSIKKPEKYVDSNLVGFGNILEASKNSNVRHLLFASSSSVYGMNISQPFKVEDITDFPISLYAATKKANELMAHSYSHLFDIPITGMRFFTVYGPYGRPDMAYFKFLERIINNEPIDVYNYGKMKRDFTYIDDVIESIYRLIYLAPESNQNPMSKSKPPFNIYNIGNNKPETINYFIKTLEDASGKKAIKNYMPMQPGDVPITYANIDSLKNITGHSPSVPLKKGIKKFVDWYLWYREQGYK